MKNLKKSFLAAAIFGGAMALVGCSNPAWFESVNYTKPDNDKEVVNEGILIRAFVVFTRTEPEYQKGVHTNSILAKDYPQGSGAFTAGVEPVTGEALLNGRYAKSNRALTFNDWRRGYLTSSAFPAQPGDLVEFISGPVVTTAVPLLLIPYTLTPYSSGSNLLPLRIICKWHDEECIARERRDYACENGAMVIDGERRPERKCGGYGRQSERFAAILGPINELYGSVEDYLRAHNSPFGDCLITDLTCGREEGNAIPFGKYKEWLETRPNYHPAHMAAEEIQLIKKGEDVSPEERAWAIYLSENMYNPEPVMPKEEFLRAFHAGEISLK